jgi:hypothetical protein
MQLAPASVPSGRRVYATQRRKEREAEASVREDQGVGEEAGTQHGCGEAHRRRDYKQDAAT